MFQACILGVDDMIRHDFKDLTACFSCRPWEAPEKVLQDAGVELGTTYPYPIISRDESQKTLEWAGNCIQKTLLENPNPKVCVSILCNITAVLTCSDEFFYFI